MRSQTQSLKSNNQVTFILEANHLTIHKTSSLQKHYSLLARLLVRLPVGVNCPKSHHIDTVDITLFQVAAKIAADLDI